MKTPYRVVGVVSLMISAVLVCLPSRAEAGWQNLGSRWVIERDAKGEAIAVDDLTFPSDQGKKMFGRISMKAPADVNLSLSFRSKVRDEWWRSVPWRDRSQVFAFGSHAPERFNLSDIDFSRATSDPAAFAMLIAAGGPGFLESLSFERDSDDSYRMYWDREFRVRGALGASGASGLRVITLGNLKENLWRSLGYQVAQNAVKAAAGLAMHPAVVAILVTAIDRLFHWKDLLVFNRREALAELLADPPEDFELTTTERSRAALALLYAETTLGESIAWIWRNPSRRWARRLRVEHRSAVASRNWLKRAGVNVRTLGANHDWDPKLGAYYLSGLGVKRVRRRRGPWLGVDPYRPKRIAIRRVAVETIITGALVASAWIPYGGGVAVWAVKKIVEDPEDRRRFWEARLGSRLEERTRKFGEDWESVQEELVYQQINPFEISHSRALALVAERRRLAVAQERGDADKHPQ